jgi:hypothetical protein
MLHAPTSENKTGTEASRTQAEPVMERERQVHPLGLAWPVRQGLLRGGEAAGTPFAQYRGELTRMQQTYGNQAVLRMRERSQPAAFPIQAKLTISQPDDEYEQEADRIADQVMRMPEPKIQRLCPKCDEELQRQPMEEEKKKKEEEEMLQTEPLAEKITPLVQRQTELTEEEKKKKEEEETLQTKTASSGLPKIFSSLQNQITALRGGGQPLPQSERNFFEPRFGTDFSYVRLHTNSTANILNRALKARAFTTGRDVFFRQGEYDSDSSRGKTLLAHELTHVMQQSDSKIHVQRELSGNEAILQNLENLRPTDPRIGNRFGSNEYALQTFEARIPDLSDFIDVAESYGLQPGNLLAVFVLEGAWGRDLYQPPSVRLNDTASLAAWHLWRTHGMDDYGVTIRHPGSSDNNFDVHSSGHRAAMLTSLGHLYAQGMLWNNEGLRPGDPRQQLTPEDIVFQLTQHVDLNTQLPNEGYIRLAYRIQAATIASRQQLIGRSNVELTQLGYSEEIVEGFRHGAIERERVRVAQEHHLFPPTVHNQREKVEWTYRHLSDPEFGRALMDDDRYRALVRTSFEHRMPAEAARITMGTPEGARQAIANASADFQIWSQQRAAREAMWRWALDVNVWLFILQGGQTDEVRTTEILHEIESGLNEENLPNRLVRGVIQDVMRGWLRERDFDHMECLIGFIIDTVERYSHVDTTRQWIAALAEPRGDASGIPTTVVDYLIPTSRRFRGRIRDVLRIYGESVRYAQGLVEARQTL